MEVWSILYHRTCGIHLMGGRSMVSKYRSLIKKESTAVNLKAVPTESGCLINEDMMMISFRLLTGTV